MKGCGEHCECAAAWNPKLLQSFKKAYDTHVFVTSSELASEWPARLTSSWAEVDAVKEAAKAAGKAEDIGVMTTLLEPSRSVGPEEGFLDLLAYPAGFEVLDVPAAKAPEIVRLLVLAGLDHAAGREAQLALEKAGGRRIPEKALVAVCVHGTRDARCGRSGPLLISAMNKALSSDQKPLVRIVGCSHLGGHKFAGVLCTFPRGDWFGQVTEARAAEIVQYALNPGPNSLPVDLFRGQMGSDQPVNPKISKIEELF